MSTTPFRGVWVALLLSAAGVTTNAFACATCGCSLSTDAAMGYSTEPGWRLSLQYDFIDQNHLHIGRHATSAPAVAAINDAGGDQEVERATTNRTTTLGIGYAPSADWNLHLLVPFVDRSHSTYGSATNPITADQQSGSTIRGLGDIRFIVSYQGFLEDKSVGVQLGIEAPTGRYGGPGADGSGVVGRRPIAFGSGPISRNPSPDNLVDTSLQPGTGSTDVVVGAYAHRFVTDNVNAFVNGQFQAAVAHRLDRAGEDFRPGNTTTIGFGARYEARPDIVPQLQINVFRKGRDRGALADYPNSAGTVVYAAPGVTVAIAENVQAFGFAQLPLYATWSATSSRRAGRLRPASATPSEPRGSTP